VFEKVFCTSVLVGDQDEALDFYTNVSASRSASRNDAQWAAVSDRRRRGRHLLAVIARWHSGERRLLLLLVCCSSPPGSPVNRGGYLPEMLTEEEAFDAMRHFLTAFWERGSSHLDSDVSELLRWTERDDWAGGPTYDPA